MRDESRSIFKAIPLNDKINHEGLDAFGNDPSAHFVSSFGT